jgi:phosphomannomutase / phosphoglucomutase
MIKSDQKYQCPTDVCASIFRAYDIRGDSKQYLTPNVAYALGLAIGSLSWQQQIPLLALGRDGRLSSPELFAALKAGVTASGINVLDIGLVPTPVLYFAAYTLSAGSGIMLTGSHNPKDDNGLKIVLKHKTLSGSDIQNILRIVLEQDFVHGQGKITEVDVLPAYLDKVKNNISLKKPYKIVLDCGNGAASVVAPALYQCLGCEVLPLYCEVDGNFPNHHPDPTREENIVDIKKAVVEHQADLGIAFDGDGDRIVAIANDGRTMWPEELLMLFAADILKRYPGSTAIYDVKCSPRLKRIIKENGGKPLMSKTGHSYIKNMIAVHQAKVAGELSGHMFLVDRWYPVDDGPYIGARLIELLDKNGKTASTLLNSLPIAYATQELQVRLKEEAKLTFMDHVIAAADFPNAKVDLLDGLRVDFPDGSFALVRASNTTACLTCRFESTSKAALFRLEQQFRDLLHKIDPDLEIPFGG